MTKAQKYTLATVIVILLLIAFLWYFFKNRKAKETCPDGSALPADGNCGSIKGEVKTDESGCVQPGSYVTNAFPLSLGMKGGLVKSMQISLNTNYNASISEDGFFGCKTLSAVKKYFKVNSLDAEDFNKYVQASTILPPTLT